MCLGMPCSLTCNVLSSVPPVHSCNNLHVGRLAGTILVLVVALGKAFFSGPRRLPYLGIFPALVDLVCRRTRSAPLILLLRWVC